MRNKTKLLSLTIVSFGMLVAQTAPSANAEFYCTYNPTFKTLPPLSHILSAGQSLAIGTGPALTTIQPYANYKLKPNSSAAEGFLPLTVVPLKEENTESIGSTLGNILSKKISPTNPANAQFFVTNHAKGGTGYQDLKKGSVMYNLGINQVKAVLNSQEACNRDYKVTALTVIHGEYDAYSASGIYAGYLKEWLNDYNADVKALTHQANSIPMFTDQMSSWFRGGYLNNSFVPVDQLAASEQTTLVPNAPQIVLVGPKYQFQYMPDGTHLTNYSTRRLAEYYARAYYQTVVQGKKWIPFSPKDIFMSGTTIYATFNVPTLPIVIDSETTNPQLLKKENYGFEYYELNSSNGVMPKITSVKVISPDTIKIELDKGVSGKNMRLRYAYTGVKGERSGGIDSAGSAHGNIRDSDTTPSLYGNRLENWLVIFDKPIKMMMR